MVKPSTRIPRFLFVLLIIYFATSLLHFADNAEFLADYPNLPAWLSRSSVYLAWYAVTAVGAAGTVFAGFGFRRAGLITIAGYAALGFGGLDHYWVAPLSAHSLGMNATIWLEVAAASALLAATLAALFSSAPRGPGNWTHEQLVKRACRR